MNLFGLLQLGQFSVENKRLRETNEELLEFVREVAAGPYPDSNQESLLNTLKIRAQAILAKLTKTDG